MKKVDDGILFFSSEWCGPCKSVKKYLTKEVMADLDIFQLDAAEDVETFTEFQVSSVPTFIKLVNGKEEKRHVGALDLKDLKEF